MRTIEFTCLLPVHEADDVSFFRQAVLSVAASTLKPAEILICQDGNAPPALEAAIHDCIAQFGARLTRNPGPIGLHHNLNHALKLARTPWIARCDADDLNAPHRFEAQAQYLMAKPEVSVLGGDLIEFWPDGRERRKTMPLTHPEIVSLAKWRNPINHNTVFYRTEVILSCGGYPELSLKEDYALWLRLIGRGVEFANIRDDLVRARLGPSFYRRRTGARNFRSEWELHKIRTAIPGMGGAVAAGALIARSCALVSSGPTRLVYEWGLRR